MAINYGASPVSLTVTNLHSLGNDAYWQSPGVDNDTDLAESVDVEVTVVTTVTAGDAAGYCDVFMAASEDGGTSYSGGASGSEGSYAPSPSADEHSKSLDFIGRIACKADETTARTYRKRFNAQVLFKMPKGYSIVIVNRTGAAIASSGNTVKLLKNTVT